MALATSGSIFLPMNGIDTLTSPSRVNSVAAPLATSLALPVISAG